VRGFLIAVGSYNHATMIDARAFPVTDPTPIADLFRGNLATELLVAATAHLKLFDHLAAAELDHAALGARLGLAPRPMVVLTTVLKAMGLLVERAGRLGLTAMAREHLVTGAPFAIADYLGLAAQSPGVLGMVERLRTNRPAGSAPDEQGAAFIFQAGSASAMEQEASARSFTLALAGRARNVAPYLADRVPFAGVRTLLDVGGGTGIYSIACVQRHPHLRAIVWDRPEVLKVAAEQVAAYGVAERVTLVPGDMFNDPMPAGADAILLSNILHDWDVPECQAIVDRCAAALPVGGRLLIHDTLLNDALDGPLPIALYSAALFCFCVGRAYSAAEYRAMLTAAGLKPAAEVVPTLVHCSVVTGTR
jgi:hypothetical protein